MRKVIEKQLKYWQVDIPSIQIDLRSRDEIYQLLLGLRAIYNYRRICEEVFTIVRKLLKYECILNFEMGLELLICNYQIRTFE